MIRNKLLKIGFLLVTLAVLFTGCEPEKLTYDDALTRLDSLIDQVDVYDNFVTRGNDFTPKGKPDLMAALPDIDMYPITVEPVTNTGEVVEIFASTEKAGTEQPDNWLTRIAEEFNRQRITTPSGKTAQIKVRSIPSGVGFQFIAAGKAVPQAFTPSNHLWIKMAEAYGAKMTPVSEKLLSNPAGVVMKQSTYDEFNKKWGSVDVKNLISAVAQGELAMGYTNPFASSTGLNFLITVLASFADNNESAMLSDEVLSAFEAFQQGVPFVSLTTLQMRESVHNDGSLDAFVMEYQTFVNVPELGSYKFIPFGIPHDNPLYEVGSLTRSEKEVLKAFGDYTKKNNAKNLAQQYGFNKLTPPAPQYTVPSGQTLIQAQQLWKEKKDSGRPILAVFLADVSGSMSGTPINALKKAMVEAVKFINPENSIGLVSFASEVNRLVQIKPFNEVHRSIFNTAAKSLAAGGGTGMYNGITVCLQMLAEAKQKEPNGKPMLFVLTDGENTEGMELGSVEAVIRGLKIPIYTIGYNANIGALKTISSINEAATIKAEDENISYALGSLLNAEM